MKADRELLEAKRRRIAGLRTKDLLRALATTPSGQQLIGDIEADSAREVRQYRKRRQLQSYLPWAVAGILLVWIVATQGGIPWTGHIAAQPPTIWELSDSGVLLQRYPEDSKTRLSLLDPPQAITLNGKPVQLAGTSGWVALELGRVEEIILDAEGQLRHYVWTDAGWQRER
jgi:hypothetical protein